MIVKSDTTRGTVAHRPAGNSHVKTGVRAVMNSDLDMLESNAHIEEPRRAGTDRRIRRHGEQITWGTASLEDIAVLLGGNADEQVFESRSPSSNDATHE